MRILGIDPGLHLTGYGCVELADLARPPVLVEGGVLRLRRGDPLIDRIGKLYDGLIGLIEELNPDRLVVEKVFTHHQHLQTAVLMAHARGAVLLAARNQGIGIGEVAPTEVKKAVTGRGHASKHQVQLAVKGQCGLSAVPEPADVADAIAIAICGARRLTDPVAGSA